MDDIAQATISGRLTRDAELSFTGNNTALLKLGIAAKKSAKINGDWTKVPHYYDVIMWGKQGEGIAPYCKKGKEIMVSCELNYQQWEKDGHKRNKLQLVCNKIKLFGGNQQSNQQNNQPNGSYTPPAGQEEKFEDDVPF